MSRILGLSGLKNLEQFKYQPGSKSGAAKAKTLPIASESVSSGSFSNLKSTAEKLVKEQASAKTDLELANSKLKKLKEQIQILEEKLQTALNENAKLKVKQKEDEKLWKGLDSKFYLTKTTCDQIDETMQKLTKQVQNAEKDKAYFEDKLSETSVALDKLHEQMKSMSLRLDSSEETVKIRGQELMQLGLAKEQMEKSFLDDKNKTTIQLEEKDNKIKQLEEADDCNQQTLKSLTSKLEELQVELRAKEEDLLQLRNSKEILVKDSMDLLSSKNDLANRLEAAIMELKNLEDFVNLLVERITELEHQSLTFSEKVFQLNALYDSCLALAKKERELAAENAQKKIDQILHRSICVTSEKNTLQLVNQELNSKVLELQKDQEFAMVQHAEDCRLAEEKIRKLESEAEILLSKQTEMQAIIAKLEDTVKISLEKSRLSEKELKNLSLKLSEVENDSRNLIEGLKTDILEKQEEIDRSKKIFEENEEKFVSLEKRVNELDIALEEKDQLIMELKTREKQLEDQKEEIKASLADAGNNLEEAKNQYDQLLESKQLELSKHLKEISHRNDQAINDIRRKCEVEKQESLSHEKEKAEKAIKDMEKQLEERVAQCEKESREYVVRVQEEQASVIGRIQQEYSIKEMTLISKHSEELRRFQIQAETELREKTASLRSEHEAQLRALRCEHQDECRRLEEELDILKTKEERQRALLQLQWKVMGDNPQDDQEVNSKKTRKSGSGQRIKHDLDRTKGDNKDLPYQKESQTPVSNLLKRVEKENPGSVLSLPKHSRKVTHHEYEIETSNGRTITKRRKTKSTVMFGDPRKHRNRDTPKAKTPNQATKGTKGGGHQNPSKLVDLFSEGSLNPYADDPYAFD
ncbi:Myosin heavy chain-related protein [Dorcoceras hygrometricum]|uniref:Myosin heavy chain-related protein n=1 Tax=Dorcoceras hygrometricum TaxID=472368 RepID=A0A2Z7BKH1_9LAMI|nr:Myosin heavy chain-related protein [Dorcoceras hygrometricum]